MAALTLLRASCFRFPLATSSHRSASSSALYIRHRCLPLSTTTSPPEPSCKSPLFASDNSDTLSVPDGLPFDSIEKDPEGQFVTLTRKTEDEIIEIQVEVPKKHNIDQIPKLSLKVKILYGDNLNSGGREHLEVFEDYFKERKVEACNINFLLNYFSKRNAIKQDQKVLA